MSVGTELDHKRYGRGEACQSRRLSAAVLAPTPIVKANAIESRRKVARDFDLMVCFQELILGEVVSAIFNVAILAYSPSI